MLNVEIEDITTWPKEFKALVDKSKELIVLYHRERSNIFNDCKDDPIPGRGLPLNQYEETYLSVVSRAESILLSNQLIAYHCTRLTEEEIQDIKETGMKRASALFVHKRFKTLHEQGYLSTDQYLYLRNSECIKYNLNAKKGALTKDIFFVCNRSILKKQPDGIYRLLRSWGGEAIYRGHENDEKIASTLQSIGTPCIIKCTLPFSDVQSFGGKFAERFLSFFIADEIEHPEPSPGLEIYITRDTQKEEVLEIIEFSNPLFEKFTGYSLWEKFYRITH